MQFVSRMNVRQMQFYKRRVNLGDQNQFIHFFKNISIAGGIFQVFVFGGGALSLDTRLSSKAFQPVRA